MNDLSSPRETGNTLAERIVGLGFYQVAENGAVLLHVVTGVDKKTEIVTSRGYIVKEKGTEAKYADGSILVLSLNNKLFQLPIATSEEIKRAHERTLTLSDLEQRRLITANKHYSIV